MVWSLQTQQQHYCGAPKALLDKLGTSSQSLGWSTVPAPLSWHFSYTEDLTGVCIEFNDDVDDRLEVELLPRELSTGNVHYLDSRSMIRTGTKRRLPQLRQMRESFRYLTNNIW
eukprot:GILI01047474.1.p1 GENE.GILI01047474.1~~GILI01047474.1.p1  ORF type:complete len:114 (+),score=1.67 GILI01047474.1:38-379(+)